LRLEAALRLALLIVPLVIGLAWGTTFDDSAYVTFRYARNLAAGRGLTYHIDNDSVSAGPALSKVEGGQRLLRAPLYALALSLPARSGVPLPQAGLVLSALGWGAMALAIYCAGRAMRRPVAAVVSATLVVFSPVVVSTLGTEISWAVAWAWVAIAASVRTCPEHSRGKRWNIQAGALALMMGAHFAWGTLAMTTLLLIVQWVERRRFPLRLSLVLAIAALGWGLMAAWHIVAPSSLFHLSLAEWGDGVQQLLDESEFYWLFLPLLGVGLLATLSTARTRKILWAGLLWGVIFVLSGDAASGAMLAALGLFLTGLGLDRIVKWIERHDVVRLDRLTLAVGLALVAGLPLGIAQASSLLQRYQLRPVVRQELERQAGDWLRAHSEATAAVLGSERVGYLADRPTFPWDGSKSDQAELANLLKALNENPPRYCVSFRSLAWDHLMRTDWFQDRYEPLQQFESPYDSASPLTVWGYRFSAAFGWGERRALNVRLPGKVDLVGYKYWPDRIQPGGAVYVTLFMRATQPFTETFRTVVRVISPHDGVGWAQRNIVAPRSSALVGWWQTGEVIAERFVLTTTADIPTGAHRLDLAVVTSDSRSLLPMYQNGATHPLDRIPLGYVVVPWQGQAQQAALDRAKPIGANLGDQIGLLSFEAADSLSPGAEFDVRLYWEARLPPEDDYVVFVHLLDANDQLVASHDGPPMDGRYATSAWLPGEVVPDVHRLALDPQIPPGTYRLQVGMYRWPSLERLPVWDREGMEQAECVIVLQSIQVQ